MPGFFDFQRFDMARMSTWVRFPNLHLHCWTPIYLSKIASMVGKPIHFDVPTTNITRLLGPKKRPYTTPIGPDSGSPSEETVAVEKQHPYNNPSCGSSC
ncbi:hypothetical protein NC653_034024 [Populus alba x Populus x berolinensis]|nr:hypothetical protein NC653_034024 [Populus alba x Populus x berolinensis]